MRRRTTRLLASAVALLLLLALVLHLLLQPQRVASFVLGALGDALGLEITAGGGAEYGLRGTPRLTVRDVVAREPGAATPLLRARRVHVSVPWSTVRSRGAVLDITRIEIDAPVLDLPALQHWLASRSPGESRIPAISDGLVVSDGRIDGDGWRVDDLALSLPRLYADQRVDGRASGRFGAGDFALHFNLAAAMTRPAMESGIAIIGPVTASSGDWTLPARLRLSAAPLRSGDDGIRSTRLRASLAGRYESGDTRLPFAFALTSPMLLRGGTLALAPAFVALRGEGLVPQLDAHGALAWGRRLLLELDGRMADWPDAWPALPPPIGDSDAPLPFALRYLGRGNLADIAQLHVQRERTDFDARFRLPDITAWMANGAAGSPVPPLSGRFSTPALDISGAHLEGVEVEIEDVPTTDAPP
ncbi:hypothetical protein [Luteimonas lutimaris]|uniref:AsmA family protein n=1 Tax=Luteimonas lutimaris TaxID=698645 RepID=A0ABP7MS96_9GAMM